MRVLCMDLVLLSLLVAVVGLHTLQTEAKCGGRIKLKKGQYITLESPGYPSNYGKKEKCKWIIKVKEEVEVNCDAFDLAVTNKCQDSFLVSAGVKQSKFCGATGPSQLITTSNKVTVLFKSHKKSKLASGFSCTIGPKIATTTTTETTTAPPQPSKCSLNLTMTSHFTPVYWESPNYDGGTSNYPDGDYCCSCYITIPKPFIMYMTNMEMESPSKIHKSPSCVYDNIQYTNSLGNTSIGLCGDLSGQSWSEMVVMNAPINFHLTWCSYRADGATAIGFRMKITGHDLMPGGFGK